MSALALAIGLTAALPAAAQQARAKAAWRHSFEREAPVSTLNVVAGGPGFAVSGASLSATRHRWASNWRGEPANG